MSDAPPPPQEPAERPGAPPPKSGAVVDRTGRAAEPVPRPPSSMMGDSLLGTGVDRVARLQTIAAVVLGLALIAIPLYLWRRPRSESIPVTSVSDASAVASDAEGGAVAAPAASVAAAVALSEAKVMECHDQGSRRTRPEDCDHLAAVEKGFAAAITSASACLPSAAGGGTLVYVVDASFGRKRHPIELLVPRDGRSLKNPHATAPAVSACSAAVKKGLDGLSLDGIPHAHSRYKVAITATYMAPPPEGR